ncbi:MAG: chemotaxis protein CheX [Pirellulales bacterium]|nr:chemotaxis protein CheX [Pirellulales bacterium]
MRVEFINPFVLATHDVFQTMLGTTLKRGELSLKKSREPTNEVCGLIGLAGKCHGMVVLSFSSDTALQLAGNLHGTSFSELTSEVVDAVGELTNMIVGAAKTQLEEYQLSIGLPTVICGKGNSINFPSGAPTLLIPFESAWGPVCVEVGLSEGN